MIPFHKSTKKRGRKPENNGYNILNDIERNKYYHKPVEEFRGDGPSTTLPTRSTIAHLTHPRKKFLAGQPLLDLLQ